MKPSQCPMWVSRLAMIIVFLIAARAAECCPFCSAPSLTMSEQVGQADAVVLVKWVGGEAGNLATFGTTEFVVEEVVNQPEGGTLAKGSKINLARYRAAKTGDLFMLFGTKVPAAIEWGSPLEVSSTGFEYLRNSPKPGLKAAERLPYFLKYLEVADKMISDDAFGEFANAAYADVAKLAKNLPREKLGEWLTSKDVAPGRLGLYGMMLGLCGNDDDAKLMESKILEPTDEFRLGVDGIMGGYLLLTGEKGLTLLEERKLKNKKATFSETYAAMQAVRFMWTYGDNRISNDRLRESMRTLLERPELADLVIADLSRMKDWSVQDRLMELYDEETNIPAVKRAIVRYMLSSVKDTGVKKTETSKLPGSTAVAGSEAGSTAVAASEEVQPPAELPAHVQKGMDCLKELERKDPKTVLEAKRFFIVK